MGTSTTWSKFNIKCKIKFKRLSDGRVWWMVTEHTHHAMPPDHLRSNKAAWQSKVLWTQTDKIWRGVLCLTLIMVRKIWWVKLTLKTSLNLTLKASKLAPTYRSTQNICRQFRMFTSECSYYFNYSAYVSSCCRIASPVFSILRSLQTRQLSGKLMRVGSQLGVS